MSVQLSRVKEDEYFKYSEPRVIRAARGWKVVGTRIVFDNKGVMIYFTTKDPRLARRKGQSRLIEARPGWKVHTALIHGDNEAVTVQFWRRK